MPPSAPRQTPISHVHVIFKTHFDFGFTDFAQAVQDQYFTTFIPQVLDQARRLREAEAPERYIWTTGSWLIYQYLETANPAERKRMEEAIEAGDIAWHALPFTFHSELTDPSLFRFGLSLSQTLDSRFGKHTIAAKMTDVPGHTRGIIPLLAEAGVEFLHIGVNEAATPPEVPPLFVWKDDAGAEITVMYQHAYGAEMRQEKLAHALAFGFTEDNVGPQPEEDVRRLYHTLARAFPDAEIQASTLDQFAVHLRPIKADLPVLRLEIADTWIQGAGTDPQKLSDYRALARLRRRWINDTANRPENDILHRFSQHLLCLPEHTWGLDEKTHLADYRNYAGDEFRTARTSTPFKKMEASWQEQRNYLHQALETLGDGRYRQEAEAVLLPGRPAPILDTDKDELAEPARLIQAGCFSFHIDPHSGALLHLRVTDENNAWGGADMSICSLLYQTFSEADFDRYMDEYLSSRPEWGILDNSKPGIGKAGAINQSWSPQLIRSRKRVETNATCFILDLGGPEEAVHRFGCPKNFTIIYRFAHTEPLLEVDVQWFDKSATRLPEALWCGFVFPGTDPQGWVMDKMGRDVSPLEVVSKGNRTLHAIDSGLRYRDKKRRLIIESLDAALVAPGTPAPLRFENQQPDLSKGWHFNLYNNLWGTNFPMWYEEDAQFRFTLKFEP